jgi:two-component system, LuxR family, sensor kinase FixL
VNASPDEVNATKALNAFEDCVIAVDSGGAVVWASEAARTWFGNAAAGASLDALDARVPGLSALASRAPAEDCLAADGGARLDVEAARDGDLVHLRLRDARGRREAQARHLADRERLILTSRSMSVGEMASTIAHELNQPLGALSNLLNGLKARAAKDALDAQTAESALGRAAEQVRYASGIIARIREYVDARRPAAVPLDVPDICRRSLDLLDWEIQRADVSAEIEAAPGLPPARGDEVMIQQVLVNLARNAIDAMRLQPRERRRLLIAAREDGTGRIEIAVADTGAGLDEADAKRLFTPFFTTKSGGMGIGLNICRSIIELHGGEMWFTRSPGGGATFHIALPAADSVTEAA